MKVQIKGFITWNKYKWSEAPFYTHDRHDIKIDADSVVVMPHDFEVEIPDNFNPVPEQIKALHDAKKEILAEAQLKANNIEEQIRRLLSIEYKPEAA